MKTLITEKQFKSLMKSYKEENIEEQEDTTGAEPKSGASTQQSGGEGYPEVSKWDDIVGSKLTRGPANQIGLTKWSDIVGNLLKRDSANQLK